MRRRRNFLYLCAALGGAFSFSACDMPKKQTWIVRYRLMLEVETPEGVKTGSGVIENLWTRDDYAIPRASVYAKDHGEAVVVDLGARGLLFALLCERSAKGHPGSSSDYAHYLPIKVFERRSELKDGAKGERGAFAAQLASMGGATADLTPGEIPFLVRFCDINDPKTVEAVDPTDLAASFGAGVRLKRATIEMTSDPVTTGIEKRLGWLASYYDKRLDGQRYGTIDAANRLANSLSSGAFRSWRDQ